MLFFQLHALLFLILSITPVFATPIPALHEDRNQALVPYYPGIKFSIARGIDPITLYRVIDSHTDPKLANNVLQLDDIHGSQPVLVAELPRDRPYSLKWSRRAVKFSVPDQVRLVEGWWLAFPTSLHADFDCQILVNVQFKQNHFVANFIDFKPHIDGKLQEVSRLSDIKGYWYPPTTGFSGVEFVTKAPVAHPGRVVQVVDDETIHVWGTTLEPGALHYDPLVVTIKEPAYLVQFSGCWIRYPLRNIGIEQRREVVCVIQDHDKEWKAFRGTWEVDTSKPPTPN
ncbi:hypothetical protein F5887DRAFT_947114 [Amanita rubescens]|nr:hypothetical protein F5887DRAFT_947114 [Amanita rubescens]